MKEAQIRRDNVAPILPVEFHDIPCHVSCFSRDIFRINNTHRPRSGCSMASLYLIWEIITALHLPYLPPLTKYYTPFSLTMPIYELPPLPIAQHFLETTTGASRRNNLAESCASNSRAHDDPSTRKPPGVPSLLKDYEDSFDIMRKMRRDLLQHISTSSCDGRSRQKRSDNLALDTETPKG
jgi:hypothetical protein